MTWSHNWKLGAVLSRRRVWTDAICVTATFVRERHIGNGGRGGCPMTVVPARGEDQLGYTEATGTPRVSRSSYAAPLSLQPLQKRSYFI